MDEYKPLLAGRYTRIPYLHLLENQRKLHQKSAYHQSVPLMNGSMDHRLLCPSVRHGCHI